MEGMLTKVIIAEDDLLIADLLEDVLVEAGYEVCGLASTVLEAVDLCNRHQPDLAVIDVRLAAGGWGTDVASGIKTRGKLGCVDIQDSHGLENLVQIPFLEGGLNEPGSLGFEGSAVDVDGTALARQAQRSRPDWS